MHSCVPVSYAWLRVCALRGGINIFIFLATDTMSETCEELLLYVWYFMFASGWQAENVSVTYVTLVPWRRERRRHVGWPTKLGSRQRDQSTSSVTKRANGHWHAIIASSCRWSPCEYKRQQVHRINSCFRWGAEPETRQLSGGTATVATGRDVSVPSFRERGLHT